MTNHVVATFPERLGQRTPGLIKAAYQHIMTDKRDEVTQTVNSAVEALIG